MEPRDIGFVVQTWLESLFHSKTRNKGKAEWKTTERPRVTELVLSGVVSVACAPGTDGEVLYGWAAGEGSRLHYVFVRQTRRRGGLGTALVQHLMDRGVTPVETTEMTRDGKRFWQGAAGGAVRPQRRSLRPGPLPTDAGRRGTG